MTRITIQEIDKLLPQTQCGLCSYPGCMPYAQALANHHANINLCLPGGVETLNKLGLLLSIDPQPYLAKMEKKAKPKSTVLIQEEACIGCTKCIQVCPVDAIIGSSKSMHTVIQNECTGCDLCIPACPVDCIEVLPNTSKTPAETRESQIAKARNRFHSRQLRLENKKTEDVAQRSSTEDKKNYIEQALARIKSKKNQSL